MSFLFPAFLAGALAVAVPILLHLLARREAAPRMPFSDLRLLKRAPLLQARRRRIREWLLLALRVAALLLLALAFARPLFDATGLLDRRVTLVALDRSFSLSPSRFARARVEARAAIEAAPARELVGLVTFDERAEVVAAAALDRTAALAALERAEPGFGATRYPAALEAAAAAAGGREGRIVLVTDRQRSGWVGAVGGTVPPGLTVDTRDVGPAEDNLAVTAVEVGPAGVASVVLNTAARSRPATVRLLLAGAVVDTAEVSLPPGATRVTFEAELPPAGLLAVEVDDPAGLQADDRRYRLLDPPDPLPIAVVVDGGRMRPGAYYLERALLAAGDNSRFRLRPLDPAAVSAAALEGVAAVVLLGTGGLERAGSAQLAAFVASGGGLWIAAGPRLDPALAADLLAADPASVAGAEAGAGSADVGGADAGGALTWALTAPRHPLFAAFEGLSGPLGQVRFRQVQRVGAPAGRVLAAFSDGTPALMERPAGRGRVLLFASDLNNEWNDFPRRPTFVPFVHEVSRYLARDRAAPRDLLVTDAPAGVAPEPGAAVEPVSGRAIVLNVDPRESDPARLTAAEFRSRVGRGSPPPVPDARAPSAAASREAEQDWWWYLLLAAAVVLAAESWLGRRVA